MQNKVTFIPLGGMDEKNNFCYIVEIDNDIFIFNTGINNLPQETLGIGKYIPDFSYLIENKKRIKVIFIGIPTENNIGSLSILLEKIGYDTPILTSEIGQHVILDFLNNDYRASKFESDFKVIHIEPLKDYKIGPCVVTPFSIFNKMPGSIGFVLKTISGAIVLIDDFIFDSTQSKAFVSNIIDLKQIIGTLPTLLLVTKPGLAGINSGFTSPMQNNQSFYSNILMNTSKRTIIALHEEDIYSMFNILEVTKKFQKPVAIYSKNSRNIYNFCKKRDLINTKNLIMMSLSDIEKVGNSIIILLAKTYQFNNVVSTIVDDNDSKLKLHPTDIFVFGTRIIPGHEKYMAQIMDKIARKEIKLFSQPKTILPLKASDEDQKLLIAILNPKYVIPVGNLYKNLILYSKAASKTWLKKNNIIITENGQMVQFTNGVLTSSKNYLKIEPMPFSNLGGASVSSSIVYERNIMAEAGVICISFILNNDKQICSKIEFIDDGVLNDDDIIGMEKLATIRETFISNINELLIQGVNGRIDMKESKILIKKFVTKQVDKALKKRPLILPTILEVHN